MPRDLILICHWYIRSSLFTRYLPVLSYLSVLFAGFCCSFWQIARKFMSRNLCQFSAANLVSMRRPSWSFKAGASRVYSVSWSWISKNSCSVFMVLSLRTPSKTWKSDCFNFNGEVPPNRFLGGFCELRIFLESSPNSRAHKQVIFGSDFTRWLYRALWLYQMILKSL